LKVALDTSFVVELLLIGSRQHVATVACYRQHRAEGAEFVLADHALIESFSVLSRAPVPYRLPPLDAEMHLRAHFGELPTASLDRGYAWEVIRHTLDRGHWGGRVHDAEIALASYEAGARLLLTWNLRDFLTVAPVGLEIRTPA
jgi:hypothetical protein